jgi:hypothetical protein
LHGKLQIGKELNVNAQMGSAAPSALPALTEPILRMALQNIYNCVEHHPTYFNALKVTASTSRSYPAMGFQDGLAMVEKAGIM